MERFELGWQRGQKNVDRLFWITRAIGSRHRGQGSSTRPYTRNVFRPPESWM